MSATTRVLVLSPLLLPALAVALLVAPTPVPAEGPSRDDLIAADYPQGRTAFQQRCSACHTLAEDSSNVLGPNLWQMMGRKAGGLDGYAYSPVLEQSGVTWTPATLLAFISDPEGYLPGNRMMIPEPVPEADRVAILDPGRFRQQSQLSCHVVDRVGHTEFVQDGGSEPVHDSAKFERGAGQCFHSFVISIGRDFR